MLLLPLPLGYDSGDAVVEDEIDFGRERFVSVKMESFQTHRELGGEEVRKGDEWSQ